MVAKGSAVWKIQLKGSYFDYVNLPCDLDLEVSTSVFRHDTLSDDNAAQVWLQKAEWFRRYHLDMIQIHRQMDTVIPIYTPLPSPTSLWLVDGQGIIKKLNGSTLAHSFLL